MHDTRTRNWRRKNGVDLWRQFLERESWVLHVGLPVQLFARKQIQQKQVKHDVKNVVGADRRSD